MTNSSVQTNCSTSQKRSVSLAAMSFWGLARDEEQSTKPRSVLQQALPAFDMTSLDVGILCEVGLQHLMEGL